MNVKGKSWESTEERSVLGTSSKGDTPIKDGSLRRNIGKRPFPFSFGRSTINNKGRVVTHGHVDQTFLLVTV